GLWRRSRRSTRRSRRSLLRTWGHLLSRADRRVTGCVPTTTRTPRIPRLNGPAMTIVNVGVSHRIAPAEVLERLAVPAAELGGVLAQLHAVPGIDEVVVLSTCNRAEVYAATSGPAGQVTEAVADLVAARGRVQADEVLRLARIRVGGAAAEHLFSVACGLDSMAVGEDQIVAQIKDAARAARAAGTTGPVITGLIDAALRASKRARTQTTISTE